VPKEHILHNYCKVFDPIYRNQIIKDVFYAYVVVNFSFHSMSTCDDSTRNHIHCFGVISDDLHIELEISLQFFILNPY
jgi:hypothetical protein